MEISWATSARCLNTNYEHDIKNYWDGGVVYRYLHWIAGRYGCNRVCNFSGYAIIIYMRSRPRERFYRDVKLVCICKVCKVEFRPERYSAFARIGLCHKHRYIYYRNWYINWFLPWFAKQSPETQQRYRDMRYGVWKKWVNSYPERRKKIALDSYHRRKADPTNKKRKHRKTNLG